LPFFEKGGREVGLDAMGETVGSEVVLFGCDDGCVDTVEIGVAFGGELGGEFWALGEPDLDRERGWKMLSCVVDRERDRP
jgi:hypothetical protein